MVQFVWKWILHFIGTLNIVAELWFQLVFLDSDYLSFLENLNQEVEPLPSAEVYLEQLEANKQSMKGNVVIKKQNKNTFYIKVFAFKVTLDYEIFYKIKIFVLFYHFALSSHLKPLFFTFVLNVGF